MGCDNRDEDGYSEEDEENGKPLDLEAAKKLLRASGIQAWQDEEPDAIRGGQPRLERPAAPEGPPPPRLLAWPPPAGGGSSRSGGARG